MIFDITEVENKIEYSFNDKLLLRQAFTHSSYCNENEAQNNERLEFLGDSLLNFLIAEHLFSKNPNFSEGDLSKTRANIVNAFALSEVVIDKRLNQKLLLSVGEQKNVENKNICGDLFEAILGAIFLDGGLNAAKSFVFMMLSDTIEHAKPTECVDDNANYKSLLCEHMQKHMKEAKLEYIVKNIGGEKHKPIFDIYCVLSDENFGVGSGFSKKSAENNAARDLLKKITNKQEKPKRAKK